MEKILNVFEKWLQEDATERILLIVVSAIIILLALHFSKRALNKYITDTDKKYKTRKALNIFGYILLITVILFTYSNKLGGIGVALGVAGAGVALALQEVILSLAGWLTIMFTGLIRVGHRVQINNIKGDIINIGLLKTTVMELGDWIDGDLYNGRIVIIVNSFVFRNPVYNYSAEYPFLWDEINVPLNFKSDHELARKIFMQILVEECGEYARKSEMVWNKLTNKYRVEKARVNPMVSIRFDENWITFTLRYIVNYKNRRTIKDRVYTRLLNEINKHEAISIAIASQEIYLYRNEESQSS